ncbi:MAG: hypothetical protein ACI4ED_08875 [Suilimivivens sp.]
MSENKDDNFWKSSLDDDFWKDEKPSENPYWQEKREEPKIQYTSSEEFKNENPYVKSHVHQDSDWVMEQYKKEKTIAVPGNEKKRIHVHTIICLIAILIAVLSIVTAFVLTKKANADALSVAMDLSYEEEEVSGIFQYNENNKVILEDEAYTIVSANSFRGFPKELKLIAIYAEVESDEYIKYSYALTDTYIGFEENGKEAYKKPAGNDLIYSYVHGYGFDDDQILENYNIGNGSNRAGYFFFIVPEDVKTITFYMEKKETIDEIPVIDTLYKKEMAVLPEDEDLIEQLAEREVR